MMRGVAILLALLVQCLLPVNALVVKRTEAGGQSGVHRRTPTVPFSVLARSFFDDGPATPSKKAEPQNVSKSVPAAGVDRAPAFLAVSMNDRVAAYPTLTKSSSTSSLPLSVLALSFEPPQSQDRVDEAQEEAAVNLQEASTAFLEVSSVGRRETFSAQQQMAAGQGAAASARRASAKRAVEDDQHLHFATTMEALYGGTGSPLRRVADHPMAAVWLHYLTIGVVIKGLCMASNVFFQASPAPKVRKFLEDEDTRDADAAPFVSVAFGGAQWVFYGIFAWYTTGTRGFLIVVYANVLGAILGLCYVIGYTKNCRDPGSVASLRFYFKIVISIVVFQAVVIATLPVQRALYISGLVSCMCSVAASASTLATLPTVLRTKSAESIPLEMAIVCLVSGLLWVICGVMISDVWLVIPNLLGFLANLLGVCLVYRFGRAPPAASTPATPVASASTPIDEYGACGETQPAPSSCEEGEEEQAERPRSPCRSPESECSKLGPEIRERMESDESPDYCAAASSNGTTGGTGETA